MTWTLELKVDECFEFLIEFLCKLLSPNNASFEPPDLENESEDDVGEDKTLLSTLMTSLLTTHWIWGAGLAFLASHRYTEVLSTGNERSPVIVTSSGGTVRKKISWNYKNYSNK